MTLRAKIRWAGAALLLAAVAAIYSITSLLAQPRLYQEAQSKAQSQVQITVAEMHGALASAATLTRTMAALAESLPLEAEYFNEHMGALIDQYGDTAIAGGGIWPEPEAFDENLQRASFFWSRSGTGLQQLDDYNTPDGSGYHQESWYLAGRQLAAGKCAWSDVYFDPASGVAMTTCTVAIHRDGYFWGVATIDLKLDELASLLERQSRNSGGHVLVTDKTGRILAAPGLRPQSLATQFLSDASRQDPSLAPLAAAFVKNEGVYALPQGVITGDSAQVVIADLPEQGWKVGLVLPDRVALASLRELTLGLYLALIPMVLIFVAALLYSGRKMLGSLAETTALIDAMSQGNSAQTLQVHQQDEIGELRKAVNRYGEHLRGLMDNLRRESVSVKAGAEALQSLSLTLSQRAQQQADEHHTLAAAITEMSASASDVSQNTKDAAKTADEASIAVSEGREVMNQNADSIAEMADALNGAARVIEMLAADTGRVGGVLDVIKAISEQTNLLALNAAIEAARAGELGRGFAVVADEVRTLAGRTRDSTREIETMIAQLQSAAQQGVAVIANSRSLSEQSVVRAHTTRESLEAIVHAFAQIHQRTGSIARVAGEQARVTHEISELANRIQHITEQNSEDAHQLQGMSRTSTELAQRLYHISQG